MCFTGVYLIHYIPPEGHRRLRYRIPGTATALTAMAGKTVRTMQAVFTGKRTSKNKEWVTW